MVLIPAKRRLAGSLLQQLYNTVDAIVVGRFAGKLKRIKTGAMQTFVLSIGMTVVISSLVWIFTGPIIGFFGLSDKAAIYCFSHIRAVAVINLILAAYLPLFGVFQGTGHSGLPAVIACGALGTRLIMTYLFRYSSFMGYKVIWLNGYYGLGVGFMITWIFYLGGIWKKGINIYDGSDVRTGE